MAVIESTALVKTAEYEYDFAVDGGAVSTIVLRSVKSSASTAIPNGSRVLRVALDVLTALSGGTSTGAIQIEAANDTVNQAATTGAPWSTTGIKAGIELGAATAVKTTAARNPSFVIGTAVLTQGKFRLIVEYQ